MQFDLETVQVSLQFPRPLVIQNATGVEISVLDGSVWLTEEGNGDRSSEDIFLAVGDTYILRNGGRSVLEGNNSAQIALRSLQTAPLHVNAPVSSLRTLLAPIGQQFGRLTNVIQESASKAKIAA